MNYSKISLFDIANGNGIRVSLFVSGCQFHCPDCFNQSAQDYNHGTLYTDNAERLILSKVSNDNYQGVSLLGGDPLWQSEDGIKKLIQLCNKCHAIGKDVWIWSGFTWEEIIKSNDMKLELIKNCDVYIDGRFDKNLKDPSLAWRGSSNQRVIDVQASLKEGKVIQL